jgi:hypothetical protein
MTGVRMGWNGTEIDEALLGGRRAQKPIAWYRRPEVALRQAVRVRKVVERARRGLMDRE